jgi:hypothetical protein
MFTLSEIARALDARRTGANWIARCPAHEDKSPSLSIRECNGKILLHCFSGCAQADVIEALRSRGLWPEQPRRGERRPALHIDEDRRDDARRIEYWRHGVRLLAELALATWASCDPDRLAITRLHASVKDLSDDSLIALYREHRRRDPRFTAAIVRAGRISITRNEELLARWIVEGMHAE